MTAGTLTLALTLAAVWAVLCRINALQAGVTESRVFVQHAALGLGLFASLLLPAEWGRVALAAGIVVFLAIGASRWRHGAPAGTRKAQEPRP